MKLFNLQALTTPLDTKEGLTHAILQSIHNHASSTSNDRARIDDDERGGYWAEAFIRFVGSRNWTLAREKITPQTLANVTRFYQDALSWLVSEGHVLSVDVNSFRSKANNIVNHIMVTLKDGTQFKVSA